MKKFSSLLLASALASALFAADDLKSAVEDMSAQLGYTSDALSAENIQKLKEELYGNVPAIKGNSLDDLLNSGELNDDQKAAVNAAREKANKNPYTHQQIMSCGAVLCLAGGMLDGECRKYVDPYFAIYYPKDPGKTARERKKYLDICPRDGSSSQDQANLSKLNDVIATSRGACETASFEDKFEAKITIKRAYDLEKSKGSYKQTYRHITTETKVIVSDLATLQAYESSYADDVEKTYISSAQKKYDVKGRIDKECRENVDNEFVCTWPTSNGADTDVLVYKSKAVKVDWVNPIINENLPENCKHMAKSELTTAYAYLHKNSCSNKKYDSVASFLNSQDAGCKVK